MIETIPINIVNLLFHIFILICTCYLAIKITSFETNTLHIAHRFLHIFSFTFIFYVAIMIIMELSNDIYSPFIRGNKPFNKYFNIIQYEQMKCQDCDEYVDGFYKRSIFGFVGWNGGVSCDKCLKSE